MCIRDSLCTLREKLLQQPEEKAKEIALSLELFTTGSLDIFGHDSKMCIRDRFVSGINCYPGTAREEMLAVKKRFGKEDGTVAYHGYQSFAPGEATPETVHEIGVKLAEQLWGEKYQVLVATHLDKACLLYTSRCV